MHPLHRARWAGSPPGSRQPGARPRSRALAPPRARPPGGDDRSPLDRLADAVASIVDFEAWAPRSSRVWRLQQDPRRDKGENSGAEASMTLLNARLDEARASSSSSDNDLDKSGYETDDGSLAASLSARAAELSSGGDDDDDDDPFAPPPAPPLTGDELGALVFAKFGKFYDVCIVRRNLAGIRVTAFNVMWSDLSQASFRLTPDQYQDRLSTIASILTSFGCAGEVRAWLLEPPRPKRGLPARPVVGNAVSLRLSVDYEVAGEWLEA